MTPSAVLLLLSSFALNKYSDKVIGSSLNSGAIPVTRGGTACSPHPAPPRHRPPPSWGDFWVVPPSHTHPWAWLLLCLSPGRLSTHLDQAPWLCLLFQMSVPLYQEGLSLEKRHGRHQKKNPPGVLDKLGRETSLFLKVL